MAIDPRMVKWDDSPEVASPKIDPKMVKWDEPKKKAGSVTNAIAGAVRGAGSIGATLLAPWDIATAAVEGKGFTLDKNRERRAAMDAGLRELVDADTDSMAFKGGKLVAEIAGTSGVGGALGNVATRFGLGTPVVQALTSGGFSAPGMSLPGRMVAGAVTGGASAGLVNPEDADMGALIGGALPGAVKLGGAAGQKIAEAYRKASAPEKVKIAEQLVKATGMTRDEVISALNQQGPQLIPGYKPTVPQVLLKPELSQLQRSLKTAGANALGDAERVQQAQMMDTIRQVSPVAPTVQDAAERAGQSIQTYAKGAYDDATTAVRRAFDSVDPFNETRINLPINEMVAAKEKYLGRGTFGKIGKVDQAIKTAQEIGTETLPDIRITKAPPAENVARAVRRAGGIKGKSGELRDLGIKQSGTTGLVNNKSGRDLDILAEEMAQRGYISSPDPDELLTALRDGSDRLSYDVSDDVLQRMSDKAMGDLPVSGQTIPKAVTFREVQNLRSSIGEAAEQASLKGANQQAAALKEMKSALDDQIKQVSAGASPGEYFPQDIADAYKTALKLHKDKIERFKVGPQAGMFRKGGDGQLSVQGAEIPGKFYSSRASQTDDLKAFKKLVGNSKPLIGDLKSFATTQAANTTDAKGNLTSKYIDWLNSRSGANRELFEPIELKRLNEVGKAVQRQIDAENLGRVTGSDTAQKLVSLQSNGLLDSGVVDFLANRVPIVNSVSAPVLSALRNNAAQQRNQLISGLLADPDQLIGALNFSRKVNAKPSLAGKVSPYLLRATPVALSDG